MVWSMCRVKNVWQDKKQTYQRGSLEESPRKEVDIMWVCDDKIGGLCRKESDGNRNTREQVGTEAQFSVYTYILYCAAFNKFHCFTLP